MNNNPDAIYDDVDYKVNLTIEKYNTDQALLARVPDEVLNVPGNCLTNKGINLIWKCLAKKTLVEPEHEFTETSSFIGIGNSDSTPPSSTSGRQALATDEMLYAEEHYSEDTTHDTLDNKHYCYMGMNPEYPLAGDNQKIVFQATYQPGVAVFNWYEWCIANGNGNLSKENMEADPYIVRKSSWEGEEAPVPPPEVGIAYQPGTEERANKILLNHRYESMGRKYAAATWIITVEVSLS